MNTHPTKLILQGPDANEHTAALIAAQVGADKPTMIASTAWRADLPSALSEQSTTLIQKLSREAKIDYALLPADLQLHDFKLLVMDMDSTLITIECIDEIADAVGRKAEVAAITEAAMRGEITDFKESLRRRLALLKGLDEVFEASRIVVQDLVVQGVAFKGPGAIEITQPA
jgi:phosphoserine phosphatase